MHFQQWPNMSTDSYLNLYRIYSQIIDKKNGVSLRAQARIPLACGLNYGTSDSTCVDHRSDNQITI